MSHQGVQASVDDLLFLMDPQSLGGVGVLPHDQEKDEIGQDEQPETDPGYPHGHIGPAEPLVQHGQSHSCQEDDPHHRQVEGISFLLGKLASLFQGLWILDNKVYKNQQKIEYQRSYEHPAVLPVEIPYREEENGTDEGHGEGNTEDQSQNQF